MVEFTRVADLSEAEREEVRALGVAVYPPAEWADWPGNRLEWATPEHCVRVRDTGGQLVSYVGVYVRQAACDGRPVTIGGVGNVKTHPAARRRGYARLGLTRAVAYLEEQRVAFGLLVCEPALLAYYGRLGWREFAGRLLVRQFGVECDFTFDRVMTLDLQAPAPTCGIIDLCGPPW